MLLYFPSENESEKLKNLKISHKKFFGHWIKHKFKKPKKAIMSLS